MLAEESLDTSQTLINIHAKVSPIVLANLLGCNVSLVYQHSQLGRLPIDFTKHSYLDCLHMYIGYYKKSVEIKLLKESNEQEVRLAKIAEEGRLKEVKDREKAEIERQKEANKTKRRVMNLGDLEGDDDGLHPLIAAKMKQDIRNGRAREGQILLKSMIERSEYISANEMYNLLEPFLQAIKNNLVNISSDIPEVQLQIDQNMENLYNLGMVIADKADKDGKELVQKLLDTTLDIAEITI